MKVDASRTIDPLEVAAAVEISAEDFAKAYRNATPEERFVFLDLIFLWSLLTPAQRLRVLSKIADLAEDEPASDANASITLEPKGTPA